METKRTLRIVVASPSDVQRERDVLPCVVEELNRGIAAERGLSLELSRWETDSYPGFHPEGPQGLIDPTLRIEDCDVLIGIFWKRFGTPTNDAQSGTEHEIQLACEAWRRKGNPQIMVYFNQKPYSPKSKEESDQREKVVAFRNRFPREGLFWSYKGKPHFERLVRNHLAQFIRHKFPLASEDVSGRTVDVLLEVYKTHLTVSVGKVYIVGESRPRDLEKVFVKLNVIEEYDRPSVDTKFLGLMDAEMRQQRYPFLRDYEDHLGPGPKTSDAKVKRTVNPDDLLRQRTQAVITGAPGCGKTTLLRYLALRILRGERLPVFLELKSVSEADFARAGNDLVQLLFDKQLGGALRLQPSERHRLSAQFGALLAAGNVAIFLDGLDEVRGAGFFPALCTAVSDFVHSDYRNNSLVISTRPYALQVRLEGLKEMEIAPLTQQQVEEFLDHYYGKDATAKALLQQLRRQPHLSELCRIPFLLSVIAQLQRTGHQLIEDRLELYRQIVQHLAVKLDNEKSLPLPRFYVTDPEGALKVDFLRYLACERLLMGCVNEEEINREANRLVFTSEVLLEKAKQFLERERRSEVSAYLLIADVKATPLLREIGSDVYAFAHLTIQEYLAAASLSRKDDCEDVFCRAYFNPTLAAMEVLPMTLGMVPKPASLYSALERLPDSFCFTNLRLAMRGLAYTMHTIPQLSALTERLIEFAIRRNPEEEPYRSALLRNLSIANSLALEEITNRMASFLNDDNSVSERERTAFVLGSIGGDKAVETLLGSLQDGDASVRGAATFSLGRIGGERALAVVIEMLDDLDVSVRERAAHAMGLIGGQSAVNALYESLRYDLSPVRWNAAQSLTQLGESGISALIGALRDRAWTVRQQAADALGWVSGKRVADALRKALKDRDPSVRANVAIALGRTGGKSVVEVLLGVLKDEEPDVRWGVAHALGDLGGERATAALLETLKDGVGYVRAGAAEALGQIGGETVIKALLEALQDPHSDVRENTAKSLGRVGGKGVVPALLQALKDSDPSVQFRVLEALGRVGGEKAYTALLQATRDRDSDVRYAALMALGRVDGTRFLGSLLEAMKDKADRVRGAAAMLLGRIGGDAAFAVLFEALHDVSCYVRGNAAKALALMGDDEVSIGLVKALSHNDDLVRRKAVEVLGYYARDVHVLAQLKRMVATDPADEIRKTANEARVKYERKLRLLGLFQG
jgi:HEAT repeat protein